MHGARWIDPHEPAELVHDNPKAPPNLSIHQERLLDGETCELDGTAVTGAARAAFDIGRHTVSRLRAVQRLDALAKATDVKALDVEAVTAAHRGALGLERLRRVLPLVDGGAESPQETYARRLLIDAGLPRPQTQIRVFGEYGDFVARIDLGYEDVLVGIEYDGPQHWTDPAVRQRDIDKQVELQDLGWTMIRASRDLLRYRQATYTGRVSSALRKTGRTW